MNKLLDKSIATIAFLKTAFTSPFSTGMICPSGPFLSKRLANQIPKHIVDRVIAQKKHEQSLLHKNTDSPQAYIVELGAGTGTVTKTILRRGIPANRLLVFEKSATMASLLQQRFPELHIIQDDAANMANYIPKNAYIACIISSLPFLSLPQEATNHIIHAIKDTIGDHTIIQYTYALHKNSILQSAGFDIQNSQIEWRNFPPAKVLSFTYKQNP